MIEAKVPEGLPKWMSEHVDSYLKSGGKDGHMYTVKPPGMDKQITVPALLLVTKGRKSGEKYLFPLFYGDTVVLTGIAQIKVTANGNPLAFGVRFTDVYARRDGRWQMVTWQSTKLP